MKKYQVKMMLALMVTASVIAGCSSEKKADDKDSVTIAKPTIPDTTRSPVTHMDTSQKPPM